MTEKSVWHSPVVQAALKRQQEHVVPLPVPESEKIATDKYNEVHSCIASIVRAMVDDTGRRVWEFTTDKGPLKLHSFYGKEHVKALPPPIENLADNTELPCNLKLFWRWKQVVGHKDVREITDIMPIADVTVDDARAGDFKDIAKHYGLSDYEWKTFKPRAEDELGQDAPLIEYKAAYERYAKELLEPKRDLLKEQALAGKKASEDPYYGTPLTKEMVEQRTAAILKPPIVVKAKEDLDKLFPRDGNGQPLEENVTENIAEKTSETAPAASPVPMKQNEAPAGKAEPQTYPNYPESPVVVYPMANGSTIYKGIKFSVTLRLGGTISMAVELMEKFYKAHTEEIFQIDPSCLVRGTPVQNAQTGGSTAPAVPTLPMNAAAPVAPSGTPDNKGRIPGQTGADRILAIQKAKANGKETIELWGTGQYAEHFLRLEPEWAMLTNLGINIAGLEVGTKYPVSLTADWIVTGNKNTKGTTYYRNVTAIRAA